MIKKLAKNKKHFKKKKHAYVTISKPKNATAHIKHTTKHTKHTKHTSSSLPDIKQYKLYKNSKGLRLLLLPNRQEISTASIYYYFKVGSKNETPTINGISHFIEHMCFKGSSKFPNYLDISKTFDSNGISFNAFTSKCITAYHYKFLSTKENLELICNITTDMIMNPILRERDIKTERNVIIQEYNDGIDDIDDFIDEKIEYSLFEGHPLSYSITGTLKTINSISRQDIIDYHKKYYTEDNLVIGFSGKMLPEYFNIITKHFGGKQKFVQISSKEQGLSQIIPFIDKHPTTDITCYPKDLKQDYVHIIFKTLGYSDPMKMHYRLISNILGGNMSSRLFVEIREKLGLVYSIKCDTSNYEELGCFDIYTQNEPKDTLKCINAIFNELVKLKEKGIDEKELQSNKKNYCDLYQTGFDDIEYENEHFTKQIILNRPIETIKERIETIQSLDANSLQNAAIDLFNFNKVHIITFGKTHKNEITHILNKYKKK